MQNTVGKQEAKSARMREKVIQAVVQSLVQHGYAETSINRVARLAGVSKGALQHHFSSKEDLMAATTEWLLARGSLVSGPSAKDSDDTRDVERELWKTWHRGTGTDEYRALLEIQVTTRTDAALHARLGPDLHEWHRRFVANLCSSYSSTAGRSDDVELLMVLNSCVVRGLELQRVYVDDREYLDRLMQRWVELVLPMLTVSDSNEGNDS